MNEVQIYKALGDPIRLKLIKQLANKSPLTIGELLKDTGVTRQGARKHLQILAKADLVRLSPNGREIQVNLEVAALQKARTFISKLESQWGQRLEKLKDLLETDEK